MSNFIDELMGSIGGEVSKGMASQLGLNANDVSKMIPAVAPLILGGLKRQSQNHGGQERVDHILNKYGSADVLNDLGGLFRQKSQNDGVDASLGGLLGQSGFDATNLLTKQFNLDSNTASRIIPMLAPVILGFLTNKRDAGGAGSSGISALLDQDGDGNILDDVAGFLLQGALGGGQSGRSSAGGLLGSLLGGLFGKK